MSFEKIIEQKLAEAVDQSLGLNEASLKVSNFTGKIGDKAGFKMKKVGDCNPGASVVLTGDEKAIIAYAKKYLGAEGDKISDFQSDLIGGPGCAFEETQLEKVECPKCEGKGCDHCGGEGYHEAKKSDEEKLDPVGKADADIDNDGDVDDADDYLKNRRKKIGKSIDAKKLKEMAKSSHIKEGANPSVVAKFKDVTSNRPYYVQKWADENNIDSDKAMEMAGYKKGAYQGHGVYHWSYEPPK